MVTEEAIPIEWHKGLLWISEDDMGTLSGPTVARELRRRFRHMPKVGFIKEPYVRYDSKGTLHLSLQAVCALCANSVSEMHVYEKLLNDLVIYDEVFHACKQLIIEHKAYLDFTLPPKPWKPFQAIERRPK